MLMSIRIKIAIVSVFAITLFGGLDYILQQMVIQPSFNDLEQRQARRNMERVLQAFQREQHHLDKFLLDWSSWDDTYEYVLAPSAAYEAANLIPQVFKDSSLNLLYLLNTNGQVVWGAVYLPGEMTPTELPDFPKGSWGEQNPLLTSREDERKGGLLMTSHGPMLITARPVLRTDSSGPSAGTMLMGRFFDSEQLTLLNEQTQVEFQLVPASEVWTPGEPFPEPGGGITIDDPKPGRLRARAVLSDVLGKPAFAVVTDTYREITGEGEAAMRWDTGGAFAAGVLVLLLLLYLMRRTVITPLSHLTDHVALIGATGELRPTKETARSDEFGTLAQHFNTMVSRLLDDAQARSEAEAALRESEDRFQHLLASLDDVVWSATVDGTEILYLNKAVENVYGTPYDAFIQKPHLWNDYVDPQHRDIIGKTAIDLRVTGRSDVEYPIIRVDGETRWIRDRRFVITDARGTPARVGGVISDITETKRMHENLLRNRHLAEIGELGASIAHQIRNPLTGISGALQVIRDGLPVSDARHEATNEALAQVSRVEQAVQQLLYYAHPWEPTLTYGDLGAFLMQACAGLRERLHIEGLECEQEDGPTVRAWFDQALLIEALENVIENAAQASSSARARIRVRVTDAGQFARIEVLDSGPGIPDTALPRLFEPFFTLKAKGTGLGLPICRRIIEAQGGAISIENRDEGGVCVAMDLPKGKH